MPSVYSQIYIQVVFALKGRQSLIQPSWEEELYKYISGIIKKKEQKLLAINGMPDHIHFLIGMRPSCSLSDLIREVKKSSNDFIKDRKFTKFQFNWQEGYGAFSYGQSQLDDIIGYIKNQKEHHATKTFKEEYVGFLKKFNVDYEDEYLFEWIE
jgi:putative transposase